MDDDVLFDDELLEDGLAVRCTPARGGKTRVTALLGRAALHADAIDLHSAAARARFARAAAGRADAGVALGAVTPGAVEALLLAEAGRLDGAGEPGAADDPAGPAAAAAGPAYAVVDAGDPARDGTYRVRDDGRMERIANFELRILRDVDVRDDVRDDRAFEGVVRLRGAEHPFAIAAADFADARRLQAAVFAAAGPGARVLADPAAIRDAASALSEPEHARRTTAHGWAADGRSYRTAGGVVDASGFRPYAEGEERAVPGAAGPGRWLDLAALDPGRLEAARRHVAEDLYRLHGRPVMATVLAAVSLAVLERFAGNSQRAAVWLKGLTGAGKSFVARLAACFFGDFDPAAPARVASWSSTANFVERAGYDFKDALYVADDFKPELVAGAQAVRVLQTYADGTGRGRLNAEARASVTRPIRGLLLATGEDLPQSNASALARTVVVPVPNAPKDLARAERCLAHWGDYRGVTADFVRWLLAEGRTGGFAARVAGHRRAFYAPIAGRPNDARVAGNFALLAAAFEEFVEYLGGSWPGGPAEAEAYVGLDLPALRDAMLGLSGEQQASRVFLESLRELLEYGKVRLQHGTRAESESGPRPPDPVGKVVGGAVELSIPLALAAVQEHLRRQGRDPLKVSPATLLEQLEGDGLLLDPGTAEGKATRPVSVGGKKMRCARLSRAALFGGEPAADEADAAGAVATPGAGEPGGPAA